MTHELDLAQIRNTARYHIACIFLEKLRADSNRRVQLRRCSQRVQEVAAWLNSGLELIDPADQIDDLTMAAALSDSGFDLCLTAHSDLLTNCSATAMHYYGRQMRNADAPLYLQANGTWQPEPPHIGMRWPDRLARIDAEIAARLAVRRAH